MKRTRLVMLALLPLAGCWSVGLSEEEAEQPWVKRAAVAVGELTFEQKDEYPKTEELDSYQADFHWTKPGAWFGYEVNASYSQDDHDEPAFDAETELYELDLGLRKTWLLWDLTLHPYVGGGVAALYGRRELGSAGPPPVDAEDEEWAPGLYLRAGVDWHFWKNVFVGVDYRILREDFIDEGDLDLDYDSVTVRLGFTF